MDTPFTAVEVTGIIDEHQQLQLDTVLPITGPKRVRVLVLYAEDDETGEAQWLQAAAKNDAFDILRDVEEDIYSLNDGKPFHDEG